MVQKRIVENACKLAEMRKRGIETQLSSHRGLWESGWAVLIKSIVEFETAKALFGAGLILQLLFWVPMGMDLGLVGLTGLILSLIGLHGISQHYGRPDIFRNYLYSFIAALTGTAILVASVVAVALVGTAGNEADWNHRLYAPVIYPPMHAIMRYMAIFAAVVAVLWATVIVSAHFLRRAYRALSEASGVDHFETAATLVWIGAWLTIIIVGLLVIFIGEIFAAIGAFSLRPKPPAATPPSYSQAP